MQYIHGVFTALLTIHEELLTFSWNISYLKLLLVQSSNLAFFLLDKRVGENFGFLGAKFDKKIAKFFEKKFIQMMSG